MSSGEWSTATIAEQALAILVMDLGYDTAPLHGHSPIRHQLLWLQIVDVLGLVKVAELVPAMKQQAKDEAPYKDSNILSREEPK